MANELESTSNRALEENIAESEFDGITSLVRESITEGRKAEALRMARMALTHRFGGLEYNLALALKHLDTAALEAVVCDPTVALEHLRARLDHHPDASTPRRRMGIRDRQGNAVRVSPLGGYRSSQTRQSPSAGESVFLPCPAQK